MSASSQIHAALLQSFPETKIDIKVSDLGVRICWPDNGPTETAVHEVIVRTGCVETDCWGDHTYLYSADGCVFLDRYNIAERAARQTAELRTQNEKTLQERENQAVHEAKQRQRVCFARLSESPVLDPETREKFNSAFDQLLKRAEANASIQFTGGRRPSWAPPLIIDGELLNACRELGLLTINDKPICRLWAQFADPKPVGTWLRENVSTHALHGFECRGFALHTGAHRGSTSNILFEAQRYDNGWQTGPRLNVPYYWLGNERERLIRERARLEEAHPLRAELSRHIEEFEQIDAKTYTSHALRWRAIELATARVLDFAGAPDVQMQHAGRLCGQCCICWHTLTDPVSLERGIGPCCLRHRVNDVKELHANGHPVEEIADAVGMPPAFVTEVIAQE